MIVFEGTDITDTQDLVNDITTNEVPPQFIVALDYVKQQLIMEDKRYENAIVTGHSLGGGITQYVAKSIGLKAYTFNSLGLHLPSIKESENYSPKIKSPEIYNFIANNTRGERDSISKFGTLFGESFFMYVDKSNWYGLHSIASMTYALSYHAQQYANTVFNHIEANFPTLFPSNQTSQIYDDLYYRYYPSTNRYLVDWQGDFWFNLNATGWHRQGYIADFQL